MAYCPTLRTAVIMALCALPVLAHAELTAPAVSGAETAATAPIGGSAPVTIGEVEKEAPPERGTGSLSKELVKHASPNENFQSVLRNVPGFTVISTGPGNLTTSDSTFTYQGFNSDQIGVNLDGVPLINTFRGGTNGQGDDHALTPIGMGQFSGVSVYSGANTPSETGINALGATLNYKPRMPTSKFYAEVSGSGGLYSGGVGDSAAGGFSVNSGALPYTGTKLYANYYYSPFHSFINHVFSINNNYYFAAVQPYNHGMSELSLITIYNHEIAQQPSTVPLPLLQKYGRSFQWAPNIWNDHTTTSSYTTILGWKSILNQYMLAKAKFFITQNNNDRTAYANAAYKAGYDGYPLPTALKSYANPSKTGRPSNTYNPTALFGNSYNGTQYQRYVDNFGNAGLMPSLTFLLPDNTVTLGGLYMFSKDHSAEYWYGQPAVPMINGYNDAWSEHDTRNYGDVFLQDRITLFNHRLIITPGAKYYLVDTTCNDIEGYYYNYGGGVSNTFNYWEPSFGVSFLATKNADLYFHYGRVYKVPNISAYYAVIGSTPTPGPMLVKPEYVDSIDTGIRYNFGDIKTSLAYFRRMFSNKFGYFYDNQTGQTFQYNVGSALYQGVTASVDAKLPYNMNAFINYSLTDAKYTSNFDAADGASVSSGEYVGDVPMYNLNFGLGYHYAGFSARVTDHVVGSQYINTNKGAPAGVSLHPYNITNLNLAYAWRPGDMGVKKVTIDLYVDNIFNANYIPYEYEQLRSAKYGGNFITAQASAPAFAGASVTAKF
ncbi:MAG: TonB-dependent receptor [Acidithiobacillus ferriphilus]|jgi:outer membrane receptor protein involved in Fe transport|uniref:TonB-dependent receptor n=1 Tax=Acidithiobacillus ferriphilus TaxID=1689834 RepID=UPI002432EA72|nr:TonB-dependent receptor [Acidithiobacillus ferriphilus]MBW9247546.1 TonB-dependent receptor [Acidithiobacillus ferriphilus]MBW9255107.1 TonB-dependent receptor [Acidithiobacillus ferriphilus]